MFQLIQPDYGQVAAGVAVGVGVWALTELVKLLADKLRETKTVKFLKKHYAAIDAVLDALPAPVASQIASNPIAEIVSALVYESGMQVEADEVVDAIHWAGQKFDWNVHELHSPASLSPLDAKLVDAATKSIIARMSK